MKRILYLVILVMFSFTAVMNGQNKSGREGKAIELLETMHMEKSISDALAVALNAQLSANPSLKPYEDILRKFMTKYMNWAFLKDKLAKCYSDEFTEDELQELIDFYRTPIGKKSVEKLPVLMGKGAELGQQAIQDHLDELKAAVQERSKELEKKK